MLLGERCTRHALHPLTITVLGIGDSLERRFQLPQAQRLVGLRGNRHEASTAESHIVHFAYFPKESVTGYNSLNREQDRSLYFSQQYQQTPDAGHHGAQR